MFMKDDKKKAVSMIISRMSPGDKLKESNEQFSGSESEDMDGAEVAAQALISAIARKEPKDVVKAVQDLMELCPPGSYEESEDESSETE